MTTAGRPRLPSAVKLARGTLRPSREASREPVYPPGSAAAPANLAGPARDEYERLAKLLLVQGLFPATAEGVLAFGCWWFGQWVEATRRIEEDGQIVMTEYGPKLNPAVRIASTAATLYSTMCSRFGLDPASAAKVDPRPPGVDADELERLRAARRAER
ncbi:MAG: phage terminase small subunit P27 family [Dehalococcoidia bacterium]|nr:phage terminase small subunit P27 family [Dehalococcoidia bacterium]